MDIRSKKLFTIVAIVALICLLGMGMGMADEFEQTDLDRLLQRNRCSGCNLTGVDLSGADLRVALLDQANLTGANLSGANLTGASWTDGRRCAEGSIGRCKCMMEGLGL